MRKSHTVLHPSAQTEEQKKRGRPGNEARGKLHQIVVAVDSTTALSSAQGFHLLDELVNVVRQTRSVDFQRLVCIADSLELLPLGPLNSTEVTDLSR